MGELWRRADMRIDWRVWIATRTGVLDDTMLRLFACYCVRQVLHLATDERSRRVVEVSVRYAVGTATEAELADARSAALVVVLRDSATGTSGAAALAAHNTAATDAGDAALDASHYAALAAFPDNDAANGAQAGWLMEYAKPNFELPKRVGKTDRKGSAK
jgi:hypothetical protein